MKDVGSSILGGSTSGIGNALGRQAADTVIETAVDTVVDAAQGGNISPASIGTSLAINAITEGVSSKTVKGQKGEVSSYKDALLAQQIPNLSKNTPKTDFYVVPDGTIFKLSDIKNKIDPFNLNMTQTVKNHAYDIATKGIIDLILILKESGYYSKRLLKVVCQLKTNIYQMVGVGMYRVHSMEEVRETLNL